MTNEQPGVDESVSTGSGRGGEQLGHGSDHDQDRGCGGESTGRAAPPTGVDEPRAVGAAVDGQADEPPELVVISGMSGAGRSTAAKVLEDLGWFVVDNLPPSLIPTMVDLAARTQGTVPRIAVVVDVRGRSFFEHLHDALERIETGGLSHRILFLESADEVLVRRFENVRRPHPLQGDGRITDGIARERELLRELRGEADVVLDTSSRNVHELRSALERVFSGGAQTRLRATVMSFGFKYGLPVDADLVVDCRFLPNPHWVAELRPRTGLDPEVSAYVMAQPGAKELLEGYGEVLRIIADGYRREGKRYMTLAVGCTGGKHRSVAMAEQMAARLNADGLDTTVVHRDMGRD